jgi:stearoyl-CoA desaturase (delta-9 desaturase)
MRWESLLRWLEHRRWQSGWVQALGFVSTGIAVYLLATGLSPWWLVPSALIYAWANLTTSVGFHRLAAHRSFECSPMWKRILFLSAHLYGLGSSISWRAQHPNHHRYADTDRDPHNVQGWWSIFLFAVYGREVNYRFNLRALVPYLRDPFEGWLHRNYWAPHIALVIVLGLLSWKALLFAYLFPVGLFTIVGGIHNVVSHRVRKGPTDLVWWSLFSISGEWLHERHHLRPGEWDYSGRYWAHPDSSLPALRFWQRDFGGEFIRLIRTN